MSLPRRIRALIVADAVAGRRAVSETLTEDPEFDVVGTAANTSIALAKLARFKPDVVTIDPEVSGENTLQAIRAIRAAYPRLPIVVFSSFAESRWRLTQSALTSGASACICSRSKGNADAVIRSVREDLIPKIKTLCSRQPERTQRVEIVVIGVSTGGPNALPVLLAELPHDFPVPVLIVQHMPANFTRLLGERLNIKCAIGVSEAVSGEALHPGHVWLAPGGHHLVVSDDRNEPRAITNTEPPENSCRPSADPLFRTAATVYGSGVLAVVMTGMGCDGLAGCESIRAAKGQIVVQDEASSVVWGMPGGVARAGLADAVLPLEELGSEIIRRVQFGRNIHASLAAASHAPYAT